MVADGTAVPAARRDPGFAAHREGAAAEPLLQADGDPQFRVLAGGGVAAVAAQFERARVVGGALGVGGEAAGGRGADRGEEGRRRHGGADQEGEAAVDLTDVSHRNLQG